MMSPKVIGIVQNSTNHLILLNSAALKLGSCKSVTKFLNPMKDGDLIPSQSVIERTSVPIVGPTTTNKVNNRAGVRKIHGRIFFPMPFLNDTGILKSDFACIGIQ